MIIIDLLNALIATSINTQPKYAIKTRSMIYAQSQIMITADAYSEMNQLDTDALIAMMLI